MADKYNPTIKQGSDWRVNCTYKDDSGTKIDLTGQTIQAMARGSKEGDLAFNITCTILDQSTNIGKFTLELSSTTSSALDISGNNKFFYDVELANSGVKTRVIEGIITITREMTR